MILIVEDDHFQMESLKQRFPSNLEIETADCISTAKERIKKLKKENSEYDLILLDFQLGEETALDLMKWSFLQTIQSSIVVMSAFATVPKVVEMIRFGAKDFIEKPITNHKVENILKTYLKIDKKEVAKFSKDSGIIFSPNSPLAFSLKLVDIISTKEYPVFLSGESGTGKELLAREIHQKSFQKKGNFVALNCAAIPETLIEAELFGYVKGSFTGSNKDYLGKIHNADQGTLFLDEIGDMPLIVQTKLLRVLQEKEITPLGSLKSYSVNFRLISATHKDLEDLVEQGSFRQDLYYRICVFPIHIPPLRDRSQDIPLLLAFYLSRQGLNEQKIDNILKNLPNIVFTHDWKGNIRELENVVSRFVAMYDLSPSWEELLTNNVIEDKRPVFKTKKWSNQEIIQALNRFDQHREKTARFLDISRRNLQYRLSKIKIENN